MTDRPQDGGPGSEGLGAEAGPDFAPPGTVQPSPPAQELGPAPQHSGPFYPPAPQAELPPPTGRPVALGYSTPPPRPGMSRRAIITLVSAVAVALIIVATATVINLVRHSSGAGSNDPWPTPARVSTPPLSTKPAQQEGVGFTFTSPAGWTRSPDWGNRNDGRIVDAAGNEISVWIFPGADPRKGCDKELKSLEVWVPGVITDLPDRKVGGRPAPGGQLAGKETYRMRCVAYKGSLFNITLQSRNDDLEAVDAAFNAVLDSWRWT